jgi:hypothetical protein
MPHRYGLDAVARRNYPSPCRESKPSRQARSPVTTLTELSRLEIATCRQYIIILRIQLKLPTFVMRGMNMTSVQSHAQGLRLPRVHSPSR